MIWLFHQWGDFQRTRSCLDVTHLGGSIMVLVYEHDYESQQNSADLRSNRCGFNPWNNDYVYAVSRRADPRPAYKGATLTWLWKAADISTVTAQEWDSSGRKNQRNRWIKCFLKPKYYPSYYVLRHTLIDLVWLTFQSKNHWICIVHILRMNRIEQLLYSNTEYSHFLSNVLSQMDTETL